MKTRKTGFKDIYGKDILVNMICNDIDTFTTVVIKEKNQQFYAVPSGLDAEPLEDVVKSLKIIK